MILGAAFCDDHQVSLDFEARTIKFGDIVVKALSKDEEAAIRSSNTETRQRTSEAKNWEPKVPNKISESKLAAVSREQ